MSRLLVYCILVPLALSSHRSALAAGEISATGSYEHLRRVRVEVTAPAASAGKLAELRQGDSVVATQPLARDGDHASARLVVPLPPHAAATPQLALLVDREPVALSLPDLAAERAKALLYLLSDFGFDSCVFSDSSFPGCGFSRPGAAEDVLGEYALKTTYYDGDYRVVTSAEKPGRYGAVVEVSPEYGRPFHLFRTLFRLPEEARQHRWWRHQSGLSATLPVMPGFDPEAVARQSEAAEEVLWLRFVEGFGRDAGTAALLAAIYENAQEDALALDRQWWVNLKRTLYGNDVRFTAGLAAPRRMGGPPARVLHEGTAAEAGMKPDATAKLDALLRQQAADGHFLAALVARHGVIVLNRAYGRRNGRPATAEDQFWLGGLTDFPAGLLLMMAADQGLVKLDDPVEKYLPPFRGASVETPLTIRHLCLHTSGLWGHWGDEEPDFEEQIGYYYPYMAVGKGFEYDGAGIALGSKIVEQVTGEALPTLYRKHLLEPLGCSHTSEMANSWDGWGTALDMGRICQMVLNKGAYGNLRFFSERAYQDLLPQPQTQTAGSDPDRVWGIGVFATEGEGLGKGAFGHWGTASMRIDPSNDLIIVVIGADRGKLINAVVENFIEYQFEDTPL